MLTSWPTTPPNMAAMGLREAAAVRASFRSTPSSSSAYNRIDKHRLTVARISQARSGTGKLAVAMRKT